MVAPYEPPTGLWYSPSPKSKRAKCAKSMGEIYRAPTVNSVDLGEITVRPWYDSCFARYANLDVHRANSSP